MLSVVGLRCLIYEPDLKNWRWGCYSCHRKFDYDNGTRRRLFGLDNPMYGVCHSGKNSHEQDGFRG